MTHIERIRLKEQYEALHRQIAEALMVCPPDEREWLEEREQEVLQKWQMHSHSPGART